MTMTMMTIRIMTITMTIMTAERSPASRRMDSTVLLLKDISFVVVVVIMTTITMTTRNKGQLSNNKTVAFHLMSNLKQRSLNSTFASRLAFLR